MGSSVSRDIESPRVRRIEDLGLPRDEGGSHSPTLEVSLGRWMVLSALISTAVLSLALITRRLTTTFVPLPPLTLIVLGILFAGIAAGLRWIWRWSLRENAGVEVENSTAATFRCQLVSTSLLLLLGVGLSVPGTGWGPWLVFWLILGGAESIGWQSLARASAVDRIANQAAGVRAFRDSETFFSKDPPSTKPLSSSRLLAHWPWGRGEEKEVPWDGELRQHVARVIRDGKEVLQGEYRCDFQENERQQTVHAVFSPPFRAQPAVEASCSTSPHINLKVAQAETFGVRVELRRRGDVLPRESVLVELKATAT